MRGEEALGDDLLWTDCGALCGPGCVGLSMHMATECWIYHKNAGEPQYTEASVMCERLTPEEAAEPPPKKELKQPPRTFAPPKQAPVVAKQPPPKQPPPPKQQQPPPKTAAPKAATPRPATAVPGVFPAAPKPAVAAGQRPTAAGPKDRHEQIQQHLQTAKDSLKAAGGALAGCR